MRTTRIELDLRTGVTTLFSDVGTYGTDDSGEWLKRPPADICAEAHKAALALGRLTKAPAKAKAKPKPK